jgi:hypothetical protein
MRKTLVGLALVVCACGPSARDGDGNGGPSGGDGTDEFGPADACSKMDFVFVVDNSGSMAEEQGNLAANFPEFISVIDSYQTADGSPLD